MKAYFKYVVFKKKSYTEKMDTKHKQKRRGFLCIRVSFRLKSGFG